MNKKQLDELIRDLEIKMERVEESARQHRDEWYEAQGAAGELQVLLWRLEELRK